MPLLKNRHLPFKILSSVLLATLLTTPAMANAKRHHHHNYKPRHYRLVKSYHFKTHHRINPRVFIPKGYHITSYSRTTIYGHHPHKRHAHKHHKARYKKNHNHKHRRNHAYKHHRTHRHHKRHNKGFSDGFFRSGHHKSYRKPVNTKASSEDTSDPEDSDPIQQNDLDALNGIDDGAGEDNSALPDDDEGPYQNIDNGDESDVDTTGANDTSGSLPTGNSTDQDASRRFYKNIIRDRGGSIKETSKLDAKATQDAASNYGSESGGDTARGSYRGDTSNYLYATDYMNDNSDDTFMSIVRNPYWNRVGIGVAGDAGYLSYSAVFEHVNPPKKK